MLHFFSAVYAEDLESALKMIKNNTSINMIIFFHLYARFTHKNMFSMSGVSL